MLITLTHLCIYSHSRGKGGEQGGEFMFQNTLRISTFCLNAKVGHSFSNYFEQFKRTHFLLVADLPAAPVLLVSDEDVTSMKDLTRQLHCCHRARNLTKTPIINYFQKKKITEL